MSDELAGPETAENAREKPPVPELKPPPSTVESHASTRSNGFRGVSGSELDAALPVAPLLTTSTDVSGLAPTTLQAVKVKNVDALKLTVILSAAEPETPS